MRGLGNWPKLGAQGDTRLTPWPSAEIAQHGSWVWQRGRGTNPSGRSWDWKSTPEAQLAGVGNQQSWLTAFHSAPFCHLEKWQHARPGVSLILLWIPAQRCQCSWVPVWVPPNSSGMLHSAVCLSGSEVHPLPHAAGPQPSASNSCCSNLSMKCSDANHLVSKEEQVPACSITQLTPSESHGRGILREHTFALRPHREKRKSDLIWSSLNLLFSLLKNVCDICDESEKHTVFRIHAARDFPKATQG